MSEVNQTGLMESVINEHIKREFLNKPGFVLKNDTPLLESGILTSLTLIKLVLFIEQRYGITVDAEELIPDNFQTIDTICKYFRSKSSEKISGASADSK